MDATQEPLRARSAGAPGGLAARCRRPARHPLACPPMPALLRCLLPLLLLLAACAPSSRASRGAARPAGNAEQRYSVILRRGTILDGRGGAPFVGDVAIQGDTIAAVGALGRARGAVEIDVAGLAVAPGFINMLSHAWDTLLVDGRAQSDVRQGVTLEVFGEISAGPLNERMKREMTEQQGDLRYDVTWSTLGEFLDHLEQRGVSPNIASFVGAGTVRDHVVGMDDRRATPEEMERMRALVDRAMCEGALGLTTALIYPPDTYASTAELVELARVAAARGGIFTAHMRNESSHLEEAIDEIFTVAREARIPAEIYHLKVAGKRNWGKLDAVIRKIEGARAAGLAITADMYTYPAAATGFDAAMPKWVQAGGLDAWIERLRDPAVRARVKAEIADPDATWNNGYMDAGPEGIRFAKFKNPALRQYLGKTLAEVAAARGTSPEDTMMDLVIEDRSRVGVLYFWMSEENVRREVALPWVSFGSDAGAPAAEGVFLNSSSHPRGYGNFARLLGKYVREERVLSLAEAIRRLTSLPARNLHLSRRGELAAGSFADIAVFDPRTIGDRATYVAPHQYATGMVHVFVNGVQVLKDGEHTGQKPGRAVRGRPCAPR